MDHRDTHDHGHHCSHSWTRRQVLVAGTAGVSVGLAGCLGGDGDDGGEPPAAVTIQSEWTCEMCGMVITAHPGPNAQIFYADQRPNDHDNPARFCSTWEAFQYDFDRQDDGWRREAFYVTDYSTVDYEIFTDAGSTLITSHPEASAFTDAAGVTFVVDSNVEGAMGPDLVGFSAAGDAEAFAAEHGGEVVAFADVTRDTIAGLAR